MGHKDNTGERLIYPMSRVDPADTRTELFCGLSKMVFLYFRDRYGEKELEKFVYNTRMNLDYAMDRTNWVSASYIFRLLDALVEYTGDPRSAFEAGTYSCRSNYLGPLALVCARFFTVQGAFKFTANSAELWSKVNEWKLEEMGRHSCVVSVKNTCYPQNKNNCLCIQGTLAALPRLHNQPRASVKEVKCACEGADRCVYHITWDNPSPLKQRLHGLLLGVLGSVSILLFMGISIPTMLSASLLPLCGFLCDNLASSRRKLHRTLDHTEEQALALLEDMRTIEKANIELQRKVESRTTEIVEKNNELQQALHALRLSQKRMLEVERQAAIGALAAGTAHEMNSPLNGIRLSLQALKEESSKHPALLPVIENADRAAYRCSRIVREMLSFARAPQQLTRLSLHEIIRDCISIFRRENPNGASIAENIDPNIPLLHLDRPQIQQAILNLLTNANDAMEGNGLITITLRQTGADLMLTVADNGPGIPPEIMKEIFNPFFSTKTNTGKGLGLGLSITYELINRNGGSISVESTRGKGACFTICFPLSIETPPVPHETSEKEVAT